MSFRGKASTLVSDGIVHYRPYDKRDSTVPYAQCHYEGLTITGKDLAQKLRARLNASANVAVTLRHAKGDMNVISEEEKLPSYSYVTYLLERSSAPKPIVTSYDVGTLLQTNDMFSAKTGVDAVDDVLRVQAVLRKYTEIEKRETGAHPKEVSCPCCDFVFARPMSLSCCSFTACAPCIEFVLAYEKKCQKCGRAASDVTLSENVEAAAAVGEYAMATRAVPSSELVMATEKRPRAGLPIVSRDVFERLRALDHEVEGQKRRGSGLHSTSTSLTREEMALANRVQQAQESDGMIPMPVMTDIVRRKIERYLASQAPAQRMK